MIGGLALDEVAGNNVLGTEEQSLTISGFS